MEPWEGQNIDDPNPASWVRLLNLSTAYWGVGPLPSKTIIALPGPLNDSFHFDNTTVVFPNAGATTLSGQPAYAVTVGVVSGLSILLTCVWLVFRWDTLWSLPSDPHPPPRNHLNGAGRRWPLLPLFNSAANTTALERRNGHPRRHNDYERRSSHESYEMSSRRSSLFIAPPRSMTATMTATTELAGLELSRPYADQGSYGTSADRFDYEVRKIFYEGLETELEERRKIQTEIDVDDVEAMIELVRRIPELTRELYGYRATRGVERERKAIMARRDEVWGQIKAVAAEWRHYGWTPKEREQLASITKTLNLVQVETTPAEDSRRSYNGGFGPGPSSQRRRHY